MSAQDEILGEMIENLMEISGCMETEESESAAGLPINSKINSDHLDRNSLPYIFIVNRLVDRVRLASPTVITAVPEGANRFGHDVARRLHVPFFKLTKADLLDESLREKNQIRFRKKRAVVIEDIRSTGASESKVVEYIGEDCVQAVISIADRGVDVPEVRTLEESRAYQRANKCLAPAHVAVKYVRDALWKKPMPLWVDRNV